MCFNAENSNGQLSDKAGVSFRIYFPRKLFVLDEPAQRFIKKFNSIYTEIQLYRNTEMQLGGGGGV